MQKHATVGDEFATSQIAIAIFRRLLPPKWIPREQNPDFHIDFLVEVTEAGELTGINFGVQLKGRIPKKAKANPIAYQLKTKHLIYYLDKCLCPIFLVLIDVINQQGYWVFMQEFARGIDAKQLRNQKRILVTFPSENNLADTQRFQNAIRDAAKYVKELHPGSITAAIQHKEQELKAKDERVDVQIDVVNGKQNILITPKQNFPFTLKFNTKDPKTASDIKNFFEKGDDLKIKTSEIKVDGLPFFDQLDATKEGEFVIKYGNLIDGHVLLQWDATDALAHISVSGRFRAGVKYLFFEGRLPSSPFTISASIPWSIIEDAAPFSVNLGFDPSAWNMKRLVTLPYFEGLLAFFQKIVGGKEVIARFYVQGNIMGAGRIGDLDSQKFKGIYLLLEQLGKARKVAMHFKADPILPKIPDITDEQFDTIDEIHGVLFEDEYRSKVSNITIATTVSNAIPETEIGKADGVLKRVDEMREYLIFNCRFQIGPVETCFTGIKIVCCEPVKENASTKLVFEGNEKSERIVKLLKPVNSSDAAVSPAA